MLTLKNLQVPVEAFQFTEKTTKKRHYVTVSASPLAVEVDEYHESEARVRGRKLMYKSPLLSNKQRVSNEI